MRLPAMGLLLLCGATAGIVSCSSSDGDCGDALEESPTNVFKLTLPSDRVSDVASVTASGPCTLLNAAPGKAWFDPSGRTYWFYPSGEGVCRITVSFRSGAPD